jgi:hypothetical protein
MGEERSSYGAIMKNKDEKKIRFGAYGSGKEVDYKRLRKLLTKRWKEDI